MSDEQDRSGGNASGFLITAAIIVFGYFLILPSSPVNPVTPDNDPKPVEPSKILVCVLYESEMLPKYPEAMRQVIFSNELRDYLDSHCYKLQDEKGTEIDGFRFIENDQNLDNEHPAFRDLIKSDSLKEFRDSEGKFKDEAGILVVISNGKEGKEGDGTEGQAPPMPEFLSLVKEWGGP